MDKFLPTTLSASDKSRAEAALSGTQIALLRGTPTDWRDVFTLLQWPQDSALICDSNTWSAMGEALAGALTGAGYRITLLNLGGAPKADMQHVDYIRNSIGNARALIAVGSGTLNDLAKLASHQLRLPYAICGTAASMNGYLSANASITENGHKKTFPAQLPRLALMDYAVLEAAPKRLTAAGLGDSVCRSTAEIDWMLSHILLDTPFDTLPFDLLKPHESELLQGNGAALITTLLLSGLGMTLAGGSYPASQGEHLMAHYAEMIEPEIAKRHFHGEQVGVATLIMAGIQQRILKGPSVPISPYPIVKEEVLVHFGAKLGASVWQEFNAKQEQAIWADLSGKWMEIQQSLTPRIIPQLLLREALQKAGAPTTAAAIGWDNALVKKALDGAKFIRNRFTFLDLA